MESEERDSLLWRLSEEQDIVAAETTDRDLVSNETLESYRRGELPPLESEALEQRMMNDPACRRRLAELAGVSMPPASAELRQRLVERFARPAKNPRKWAWLSALWQPRVLAFAMAATLTIGAAFWLRMFDLGVSAEIPIYEVSLQALSQRRGEPEGNVESTAEPTAEAYAETPVVIDASVSGRAVRGIEVALYRVDGDHLRRIEDGVERTSRPGAVRFEATAAALVGTVETTHTIFMVIGREPLPAALARPEETQSTPFESRGYRFHRLLLRLTKPIPAAAPAGARPRSDDQENSNVYGSTIGTGPADSVPAIYP